MSDAPSTPTPTAEFEPPIKKRRLWPYVLLAAIILMIALPVGGWFALESWSRMPFGGKTAVPLTIDRGMSTRAIALRLKKSGLITNDLLFMAWLRAHRHVSHLQAGRYTIQPPITPADLIVKLSHGVFERSVTIPEGWTTLQIARRLREQGWIANEKIWMDLTSKPVTSGTLGVEIPHGAEGFCFPETYSFEEGTRAETILARMLDRFHQQWQAARPEQRDQRSRDLSLYQVVTLASMIEREARTPEEMPMMASVYLNRLGRGMKLQCDATVYYALGKSWDEKLRLADLEVDHPYNTYKRLGLPPGPISNPSQRAIEAVLRPNADEFLFYVYAGDKHHVFTKTFAEHQAAIRTIQKRQR